MARGEPKRRPDSAPTRALERGLRVLEAVAARPASTLADVAAATELSPSIALRILDTLRSRGFVERAEKGRTYSIGVAAFRVGSRFRQETRLRETCAFILSGLVERTGQTALLAVLDGPWAVVVDTRQGTGLLRSAPEAAGRLPAHATAAGKALLAWQWEARLRALLGEAPFPAFTDRTRTEWQPLAENLAAVRAAGLAAERGEHDPDVFGLACPVRNLGGDVIAALAIQGPLGLLAPREAEWGRKLMAAGREASSRLGWREVRPPRSDAAPPPD